ncbi:metallo-beta-lactamase [Cellulophaga lytica]|uniref:MBL fold metallo-hydrolase n=1 Tax=Cellulophaga lytica TaxID=979 RepID=UPI0004F82693|nr:MBL fold metallo-hydrolase [Cellulophaga lytica]AIM59105.1 metallo-beta-lactamase [Cellulophaga lytica]
MMKTTKFAFLLPFLMFAAILQSQSSDVKIQVDKLTPQMYMLTGQGGNIGVFVGEEYVLMIDDQFSRLSTKIKQAIKSITTKPIVYLLNTHMHGDHTGGNANFNNQTTTIIAHQKVRERLVNENEKALLSKKIDSVTANKKLPEITFSDTMLLYDADETIMAIHVHNAHTDGDAQIYFSKNNVLHMGDTYFSGKYPYIDLNRGGSVGGYINALKKAAILANEDTKIIPGHGKLSNKKELESYILMLETIYVNVKKEIGAGKSLEQVIANKQITANYDATYAWSFISAEKIRETFYKSLMNK